MKHLFTQHLAGVVLLAATIICSLSSCTKEVITPNTVEDSCNCGTVRGYYYSCTLNWVAVVNDCSAVRDTFYLEDTPEPQLSFFDTYCADAQW